MKKIPIIFKDTNLSAAEQNQLALNLDNGSRILLGLLNRRLGKTKADQFKIYVAASDPEPGTYQTKTVTPTTSDVDVTPDTGYDALSKVTVKGVKPQEKTATPATTDVEVTPDESYDYLSKVTVSAVTAAIDENIVAENIKKDVVILGVTGTYEG